MFPFLLSFFIYQLILSFSLRRMGILNGVCLTEKVSPLQSLAELDVKEEC